MCLSWDSFKFAYISVIGLGSMGFALAETLLKADFNISVWNRTLSKAQKLENKGANICSTPNEAFKNSQFIVASLSNYEGIRRLQ